MRMDRLIGYVLALSVSVLGHAQILQLAELNTTQVQALDRAHTVVLIPNGIMEEHGPYMPSFTDGYLDEAVTQDLARRLVERPGWTVVLFPVIPIGTSPANVIGEKFSFPGSYTVRHTVVRDLFMDLADAFGELGFKHIFIIDSHGGPPQSVALDAAGDYFHDTYGGQMVHLLGAMRVADCCHTVQEMLPKAQADENGLSVHADTAEQSLVLFLRPDLVPAAFKQAKPNGAADFPGLIASARKPDWPGYLGSPAYASAAMGARNVREIDDAAAALAFEILDGKTDPRKLERYGNIMMKMTADIQTPLLKHEAEVTRRHQAWLAKHPNTAQQSDP